MNWKTIQDDNDYEISDTGLVRRKDNQHIRALQLSKRGYYTIKIRHGGKNYYIHRLVAEHFVENDDPQHKTAVNHIDGDRTNNVASNLEWVTNRENSLHYFQQHKPKKYNSSNGRPVAVAQLDSDGNLIATYSSITEGAKAVGLTRGYLAKVVRGERKTGAGYYWEKIDEGSTTMWEQNPSSPAQTTLSGEEIV